MSNQLRLVLLAFGGLVLLLLLSFRPPIYEDGLNLVRFGSLPVLHEGRVKPIDTVARQALLFIHGKQSVEDYDPIQWLLSHLTHDSQVDELKQFIIYHPSLQDLLGLPSESKVVASFTDIAPGYSQIINLAETFRDIEPQLRNSFQKAVVKLDSQVQVFIRLKNTVVLEKGHNHLSQDVAQLLIDQLAYFKPLFDAPSLIKAYALNDSAMFNKALLVNDHHQRKRVQFESLFNHFQLFYKSLMLYVVSILFVFIGWLTRSTSILRFVKWVMILSFAIQTIGIVSRMIIESRPPVTNLYSSAVFVGWVSIGLAFIVEQRFKNGIALLMAAVIGFLTLIIAHHLSIQGDTLEMMQAVLDTNFWLSTHVVTITMGYGAAFLAGFFAIFYILKGVFTSSLDSDVAKKIEKMTYGITCFSLLMSTVGTILGGIWADQSWGRFWGWDPKENGALLLVLWLAIILHARWGGLVKQRGIMVMSVFNNVVTAFSWFGVNMLGIGLHSYGFMDRAFFWLLAFSLANGFVMYLGLLPKRFWRS